MKKESDKFAANTLFEGMVSLRPLLADRAKRKIEKVLVDQSRAAKKARELSYIKARSHALGFPIEYLPHEQFEARLTGTTSGGIAALCGPRVLPSLHTADIVPNGFYVMLEGIEDPYNFGYALRSLYAAGADGIILSERNWMSAAGVVCRASAGASELFDLLVCAPEQAVDIFRAAGYSIVAAGIEHSVSAYATELKKPLFLIVGGEKRGISSALLAKADQVVRLDYGRKCPFALSAASAASILGFEIFRQNNF